MVRSFIGQMPVEGQDYGDALGTKIANYGAWDNSAAWDGWWHI